MAILKCKMCGGDLNITEGVTVFECEYCGTKQTIPTVDDEKKSNLFNRANRLRMNNEFDKAAGVYESLVSDFPEEAEAYWGLVLCKYGIEYVDDPKTGKMIPTCHRSSFESVLQDKDFEMVMEYADSVARRQYREEAKAIEELRKAIIEVSSKEEPYDIFICYKETDENGDRTMDSVIAQDVYTALTEKGYRIFFSRITLEDKLGVEYEPYIFAALNSAKIMLAFGTDYDYYNAVWVKNEWSRFLQLIEKGEKKTLIPCYKNIDAYDMPKEFTKLQAQDMGKVGAIQDLVRGVEKIIPLKTDNNSAPQQTVIQPAGPNVESLLKRGFMALEDGKFDEAKTHFDKALDIDAECAEAYLGLAMVDEKTLTKKDFVFKNNLDNNNYKRAMQFATQALLSELNGYEEEIKAKEEADRDAAREKKYIEANTFLENGNYKSAIVLLNQLGDYKNSKQLLEGFNYIALAYAKQNGKYGFIDGTGEFVIKPIFEDAENFDENGLACVKLNEKRKLIDTTGEFVIRPTFEDEEKCLTPKRLYGKWGFVNKAGTFVIEPTFNWAWHFAKNGLALVQRNNQWGYIDKSGVFVINPRFYRASSFAKNGLASATEPQSCRAGYIDKTGTFVIKPIFYDAYDFNEFDIARVSKYSSQGPNKHGVIDKTGEFVIEPTFDMIYPFDKNGFAEVIQNEKSGLVDKTGKLVIPPIFDEISGFSENGLARAKQNEKWGFIDKTGSFVINPIFEDARSFQNGLAVVQQNEKWGFIDETGEFVIKPAFDYAGCFSIILQSDIEQRRAQWEVAKEKQKLIEEQQRLIASRKQQGLCVHCGGTFKGLFTKKCTNCGREKDY